MKFRHARCHFKVIIQNECGDGSGGDSSGGYGGGGGWPGGGGINAGGSGGGGDVMVDVMAWSW